MLFSPHEEIRTYELSSFHTPALVNTRIVREVPLILILFLLLRIISTFVNPFQTILGAQILPTLVVVHAPFFTRWSQVHAFTDHFLLRFAGSRGDTAEEY